MKNINGKKVTIYDIARLSGFSPKTVSRVINGGVNVKPQLFTPNLKTIQNPCLSLDPGWFLFS
ncbi:LacI family DNA-binding transcriptional regulator, partial [Streptococcus pneumoniae]|nr:LacI family DNA-binding transcriptional regulator [Streptococcus pneumoniae]